MFYRCLGLLFVKLQGLSERDTLSFSSIQTARTPFRDPWQNMLWPCPLDHQRDKLLEVLIIDRFCFAFFHRYSIELSSSEYSGSGYTVRRSGYTAKKLPARLTGVVLTPPSWMK